MSRAEIVVDLAAIRHNVRALKRHTGVPMMTVVKADGYGHGMVEVARAARTAGADWLGVASLDEGLMLRAAGDDGPILAWLIGPREDVTPAIHAGLEVTAYSVSDLDRLDAAAAETGRRVYVQLKVDTGLNRGGAALDDWPAVVTRARELEKTGRVRISGVWSHFSSADEPDRASNDAQEKIFCEALALAADAGLHPEMRHLANSAAALNRPSSYFDLTRCGIATYGLDPALGTSPDVGLIPAMTVRADLVMVKNAEPGAAVSYGETWTASEPTTLGLVPAGYGEGILRSASNRADVLVDGSRRPIRGRVCMDQFVVDLGGDRPEPGSDVVLWGPGTRGEPTAHDWADAAGTISYEVVTRTGGRLARRFVNSGLDSEVKA